MLSQSFHRVVEYDIAVMGGSFREVSGIDKLDALLARDPRKANIARQRGELMTSLLTL